MKYLHFTTAYLKGFGECYLFNSTNYHVINNGFLNNQWNLNNAIK